MRSEYLQRARNPLYAVLGGLVLCVSSACSTNAGEPYIPPPPLPELRGELKEELESGVLAFWKSPSDQVWAVGRQNLARRTIGPAWVKTELPIYDDGELVVGSSSSLRAVWGSSDTDVWIAGDDRMVHWDGTKLADVKDRPKFDVHALWGASASDIWAAGSENTVAHYDGTKWTQTNLTPQTEEASEARIFGSVEDIWGSRTDDVWFVRGRAGGANEGTAVFHWDGAKLAAVTVPKACRLHSLWGVSSSEIWGVTQIWELCKWDGRQWTEVGKTQMPNPVGFDGFPTKIRGTSASNIWLGASHGAGAYRWNGKQFAHLALRGKDKGGVVIETEALLPVSDTAALFGQSDGSIHAFAP